MDELPLIGRSGAADCKVEDATRGVANSGNGVDLEAEGEDRKPSEPLLGAEELVASLKRLETLLEAANERARAESARRMTAESDADTANARAVAAEIELSRTRRLLREKDREAEAAKVRVEEARRGAEKTNAIAREAEEKTRQAHLRKDEALKRAKESDAIAKNAEAKAKAATKEVVEAKTRASASEQGLEKETSRLLRTQSRLKELAQELGEPAFRPRDSGTPQSPDFQHVTGRNSKGGGERTKLRRGSHPAFDGQQPDSQRAESAGGEERARGDQVGSRAKRQKTNTYKEGESKRRSPMADALGGQIREPESMGAESGHLAQEGVGLLSEEQWGVLSGYLENNRPYATLVGRFLH